MRTQNLRWAVATLLLLRASLCLGADTLFFQATSDNKWSNPANWFFQNAMGQLENASKIPAPGDFTYILSSVVASNGIVIGSLNLQQGISVTGGDFTVDQVTTGPGATFTNSIVQVLVQMNIGGICSMTGSILTIDKGAFCQLSGLTNGLVGSLILSNCTVFNIGEIILTGGS